MLPYKIHVFYTMSINVVLSYVEFENMLLDIKNV